MRLFLNQTNLVSTSRLTNKITGNAEESLVIVVKVFDETDTLVPDSTITLSHVGDGYYRNKLPKLEELIDDGRYQLEMIITKSGEDVWYFKGPIKAIVRKKT